MKIKDFDFLDFGASKGGSIDFAKARLGGKRGLGIDIDPARVKNMKKAGYDAMVGDFVDLELPASCVRFVLMSHILEHLPDLGIVKRTIATAKKSATDFLVITGPFFDEDKYLASKGFRFHWSDYTGHTCHLTTKQLMKILRKLKLNDYELYLRGPIKDSSSEHIHSLKSPRDSLRYDAAKHPPKKHVVFDRDIWTDFVCYVRLKKDVKDWDEITKGFKNAVPYPQKTKNPYLRQAAVAKLKTIKSKVRKLARKQ